MSKEALLEVKNLQISFKTLEGQVHAIRDVSFTLNKGETLAIVGESGSGKSVSTKAITRILPKGVTQITAGEILYEGRDLLKVSEKEMTHIRGKDIAMIFQDPMTSLNPVMTVGEQIAESLREHQGMNAKEAMEEAKVMMSKVGINQVDVRSQQYPHQFSGGMRQRVMIALALACKPKILIADEPTTALDVTIQAQIIELMNSLKDEFETSLIFITHDLGVVANVADRVAVMYAGRIIEDGSVNEVFYYPQHPYTWGLLASMPSLSLDDEDLYTIPGAPPNMMYLPKGDPFAPRNQYALAIDFEEEPPMFKVSETHYAATWLLDERAPKIQPPEEIQRRFNIFHELSREVANL